MAKTQIFKKKPKNPFLKNKNGVACWERRKTDFLNRQNFAQNPENSKLKWSGLLRSQKTHFFKPKFQKNTQIFRVFSFSKNDPKKSKNRLRSKPLLSKQSKLQLKKTEKSIKSVVLYPASLKNLEKKP